MNPHKNARLTPHGRALLVYRVLVEGLRPREVAQSQGVSVRTVYKWLHRYRQAGSAGLENRCSRPHRCPHALSDEAHRRIVARRRKRQSYHEIARALGIGHSTVARILKQKALNRLAALEPPRPDNRYEHNTPGDLLHLDIKKLARFKRPGHRATGDRQTHSRGAGWEHVHIAIDDHSRMSYACVYPDETARSACQALLRAVRYYRSLGIRFTRVLTDNGGCYKSRAFRRLCRRLGIKHRRTKAYSPRTNGKAERFIQTALREWAYARTYHSSRQRQRHLPAWLHHYNWHRPHASLNYLPPVSRLALPVNNLVGLHT